ncbi:hypothetical protein OIDMADRAFT_34339 [Oidiodendron maius Zn]|uniref:Uncharacterized protein n=1 Tax=Oidiodendron maius (strain Zn) TaxID=913774 RepID=A0A0C3GUA1_OIDMZ|nr:hypothetical protein OIDMADRAFT_34339 [Oidiodendron maius Zn]
MKARGSGTATAPEGPSRRRHRRERTERITRMLSFEHSKRVGIAEHQTRKFPARNSQAASKFPASGAGRIPGGHCVSQGEKHAMELGFPGCRCRACMSRAQNPTGSECRAQTPPGTVAGPAKRWG